MSTTVLWQEKSSWRLAGTGICCLVLLGAGCSDDSSTPDSAAVRDSSGVDSYHADSGGDSWSSPDSTPFDSSGQEAGCSTGYSLCGGECVDTQWDNRNCGKCDHPCEGATMSCVLGECREAGDSCDAPDIWDLAYDCVSTDLSEVQADYLLSCGPSTPAPDFVTKWTPSKSGNYRIFTDGTPLDGVLAIFSASSCASQDELVCDDDSGGDGKPELVFSATVGTDYYVVVTARDVASYPTYAPLMLCIRPF